MNRTDIGKEFCDKAMVIWALQRGLQLRLAQPRKPNQNTYIKSFNGRQRLECLNGHRLTRLRQAGTIIETWRGEYHEGRPREGLSGLTPTTYAKQLANTDIISPEL